MERLVKFEVLGHEYPLYTAAPEEDVREILQLVKSQLEALSLSSSVLPSSKLAILTSLNVASKYVELKRDFEKYREMVAGYSDSLVKKIDDSL
ncbi:MAG: cell division protein ZapA [Proteobacteria bacterium]|nr:cell division protein ZapA [Pseudomonadota bacterium]MBU1715850.1 cell division protein ZapA [Pseudomonadota bacterium]